MPPVFVEVAFPIPLNRTFHYHLPVELHNRPLIGCRVLAPFGKNKDLVGYVIATVADVPPFKTKPITALLDEKPFIDDTLLALARWIAERYLCSLGEALSGMAPPHLSPPKRPRDPAPGEPVPETAPVAALRLSPEQKQILERLGAAIRSGRFAPFLLRGITDSGKTEIYLQGIDEVLQDGGQALYLLPEIALTPVFLERLQRRYPGRVALWHSGLSNSERYRIWSGIRSGEIGVLLGARSAVFAPFARLRLIVIDEEHEGTYKQEDRPRYHARDVARRRAELTGAVLILGSATPSLEAYWQAQQGAYTLLELTSRVEARALPPVHLIDRRHPGLEAGAKRRGGAGGWAIFSEPLKLALEQRLARREQVMLFVNRRGFTPFLRCSTCGWVARCPRCSTTLALHIREGFSTKLNYKGQPVPADAELQCHACLHRETVPLECPVCHGLRLRNYGVGTQRVEEEVKRLFPFAKTARLDHDAVSTHRLYEKVYQDVERGVVDVLVGTQMIAKGFDFPRVTLVGVVDADVSLHLPDFRASERTFDLITQVAGRTGRGKSRGEVLVQTHHPEHEALRAAKDHDYLRFYEGEIAVRRALRYPPFCRLVSILIRGTKEPVVQKAAEDLGVKLQAIAPAAVAPAGDRVDILGPAPAPYARLRNQFRFQILLKGTDQTLAPYMRFLHVYRLPKAFMSVDVDPMDLL